MDKHSPSVSNPLGYKHDKKKGFQAVAPQKVRQAFGRRALFCALAA